MVRLIKNRVVLLDCRKKIYPMGRTPSSAELYKKYVSELQEIADLRYAAALLQWDQETYMPPSGAAMRARQVATLSEIAHERFTSKDLGNLLETLSQCSDLTTDQAANIRLSLYDYHQQVKLPPSFVRKSSETSSRAFHAWIEARRENDFKVFEPLLVELVALKKEETRMLGYSGSPYNALLNQYERDCTTELLDGVFGSLMGPLKALLRKIAASPQVEDGLLKQFYPEVDQWNFGMELLKKMGFDTERGRQDRSEHPFTTNFSSQDVRITTRIDEQDLSNMTFSTIHELGHALYEQGLPAEQYGLPLGEYASLGIHESQSRLWENNVGRSLVWVEYFFPLLRQYFPSQLGSVSPMAFYSAINKVSPSLIRTEADELTYHFHVIIRYEIEKGLIEGSLAVSEIPAIWKEKYRDYLGIEVPDDRNGCLQDVHWSHGSFGYFPTYSLGSIYAAQFFGAAEKQIPDLESNLKAGNYQLLLDWLRVNLHQFGRKYSSEELCRKISGEGINIGHFMQYVTHKYRLIYAFETEEVV